LSVKSVPYLEVICFGLAIENGAHGAAQYQLPVVHRSSNFDEHRESSAAAIPSAKNLDLAQCDNVLRRFITAAQKLEAPLSTEVSLQDKSHRKLPKLSRTDWQLELQRTELRASPPEIETEFCSVSVSRAGIETIPFSMNFKRADRGNGLRVLYVVK
jgi:hypothetical protein